MQQVEAKKALAVSKSLEHMDNKIVQSLFNSIINLIKLFTDLASEGLDNDLFLQMSERLNELGREDCLFNALIVPDDYVKLSVVSALYVVPLDAYQSDEINRIIEALTSCKNIGAGETERILALIFHNCTRFVQH